MRILRNYLLKEFFGPLFLALVGLTFLMLLGNLVKLTDLVINRGVDIWSITKLFLYMVPALLTYTLPIAVLTAVLFSFGRLSSDNEIVAIRASGINLFSLVAPVALVGVIVSLLLVIFNDRVIPYAHFATRKTLIEVGVKNPTAALEPGVFINSFQKYVLFIYKIEDNKMLNVRIYQPEEGKPTRTIVAKRGEFIAIPENRTVKLKLVDGTADEPDPENPANFFKLNFKTYFMTLNMNQNRDSGKIEKKPKDMTIQELRREIKRIEAERIDPAPLLTELHKKISLAFSCLVFILLGTPLAIITHRREKSINFGIAVVTVGLYYVLLVGSEALSLQGYLPAGLSMWLPNILLGSIGAFMTYKVCAS
jgi:lipopolysaccharide export system permease protein